MIHAKNRGSLEVICGSMFSGKTEELIRRLRRAQYAQRTLMSFKHSLDQRHEIEYVTSHSGARLTAIPTDNPQTIETLVTTGTQVVGIDEVQFFHPSIVDVIMQLVEDGKNVIVAGLDLDFRGLPFGCMPQILTLADSVTKLKAICVRCGNDAHFSQRLINGAPASFDDPIIMIGAQECYEARCRACFSIDKRTSFVPAKETTSSMQF